MRTGLILGIVVLIALALLALGGDLYADLARWAVGQQRAFQQQMAAAVRALNGGEPGAWAALLGAAGAYGFVHAIGPGHGKFLIGGVGIGSAVSAGRLVGVAVASSIAQAIWAIILIYGGFLVLEVTAPQITGLAETYLAPASYFAIGAIGAVLVLRGIRALMRRLEEARQPPVNHPPTHRHSHAREHHHRHDHACGCGAHGPAPDAVARIRTARDAAALIFGIALRPCSGALFLLVIAWQLDLVYAGAAAVIVMGLGVAAMTTLVALSSIAARTLAYASSDRLGAIAVAAPSLQLVAGLSIIWFAIALLRLGGP